MPAIPNAVALAGWIRLSDVRQPCGLADGPRAVDVPFLQPADLDHGWDDLSPLASAAQDLVLGGLGRLRSEDRRLGAGSAAGARFRLLRDGLGLAAQAPPGDGAARPGAARWPGRDGRVGFDVHRR